MSAVGPMAVGIGVFVLILAFGMPGASAVIFALIGGGLIGFGAVASAS